MHAVSTNQIAFNLHCNDNCYYYHDDCYLYTIVFSTWVLGVRLLTVSYYNEVSSSIATCFYWTLPSLHVNPENIVTVWVFGQIITLVLIYDQHFQQQLILALINLAAASECCRFDLIMVNRPTIFQPPLAAS